MKRFSISLKAAFLFACALVFFSCSNINEGEGYVQFRGYIPPIVAPEESGTDNENQLTLGISIDEPSNSNQNISKTILPIERIPLANLTFVLKAVTEAGVESYYVFSGGSGSQYSVTIKPAVYHLFLYAYKSADVAAASITPVYGQSLGAAIVAASDIAGGTRLTAAYHGFILSKDLTDQKDCDISFELSPAGLEGYGKIQLGGAYVDERGLVYGIKVGVYDIETGMPIEGRNDLPYLGRTPCVKQIPVPAPHASSLASPSYFGSYASPAHADIANKGTSGIVPENESLVFNVPCGSYRVAVYFYADNSLVYQLGYWSDIVVVEPANVSDCRDIVYQGISYYGWIFP